MGDGVVETHLDQPPAHRQRDQALGRLAGDAELGCDLVLGIAGDVIEPTGPGRLVEPVRFRLRCLRHRLPSPPSGADDSTNTRLAERRICCPAGRMKGRFGDAVDFPPCPGPSAAYL